MSGSLQKRKNMCGYCRRRPRSGDRWPWFFSAQTSWERERPTSRPLGFELLERRELLSLAESFGGLWEAGGAATSRPVDARWFASIDFASVARNSGENYFSPPKDSRGDLSLVALLADGAKERGEQSMGGGVSIALSGELTTANGVPSVQKDAKFFRQWIVTLAEHASDQLTAVAEACELIGLFPPAVTRVKGLGQRGVLLVEWESEEIAAAHVDVLASHPLVTMIEPNGTVAVTAMPNDPLFLHQWALHNRGDGQNLADADIDAPEAWDIVHDSSAVVAVVDTGIDYRHPDLVQNIWVNAREIPGNGRDDDGNGFVDDVYGYDFLNEDGDPFDDHGHGTHVAGIIGAGGNNSQGVTGVAWRVRLMPVKFLGHDGTGSIANAVRAVNYVTLMRSSYGVNVRAINASWGTEARSSALEAAIKAAGEAGIIFVAAAGNSARNNDWHPHYPSNYQLDNVISVAASDARDQLASFSNYGASTVHVAAPGVNILSTYPGERYAWMSGTSMAAPFVSGTIALAAAAAPSAGVGEIRRALLEGVDRLPGWLSLVSAGGRLNARGTLQGLAFRVLHVWPAEGQAVSEPPALFRVQFSAPIDPRSVSPQGFLVNGQAADGWRLTAVAEVEFYFSRSPVLNEGLQQMMVLSGAARQMGTSRPVAHWEGTFYYDRLPGRVMSAEPPPGAILPEAPREFAVTWNEAIAPSSVASDDLLLSEGRVVGAALRGPETVVYRLADLPPDGTVEFVLPGGSLRDIHGNPQPGFAGVWTIRDPQLLRFSAGDVPQPIVDYRWTRSLITVAEPVIIADVDVFVTIEHTYIADLDVYLVGPDGTRVLLWADVGGAGKNFTSTILDDEAPVPINQGVAPFRGRYRPMQSLAVFKGQSAQGVWALEIYDDSFLDQGALVSWGLLIRQSGRRPVQVVSVRPAAEAGGEILEAVRELELLFSEPVLADAAGFNDFVVLATRGLDGLWDTEDDQKWGLSLFYDGSLTTGLKVVPHAGRLPPGEYRLRLMAEGFRGQSGVALDGDGDGNPGGDFVFPFRVLSTAFYGAIDVTMPIRDLQRTISEIFVSDDFVLKDVDVFLDIEHSFTADLDIFLQGPDGTRVALLSDVGGSGDHFRRTILDDEASTPITEGQPPFTGRYQPEEALAAFRDKQAWGTWRLEIYDDSRRDEGTLLSWGLLLAGLEWEMPRVVHVNKRVDQWERLTGVELVFSQAMDASSFHPREDILAFSGPSGPVPVLGHQWINDHVLEVSFAPQSMRGEYLLRLSPWIADKWGFHLDGDGDGIPGEIPEDVFSLRIPMPVLLGSISEGSWQVNLGPDGVAWIAFENLRAGIVTIVAESEMDTVLEAELLGGPFGPKVASATAWGTLRLDVNASHPGQTWYLRLRAAGSQAAIRIVNALEQVDGGVLNVYGTKDDDVVTICIQEPILALWWNGIAYQLASESVARVHLFGGGGEDALCIRWLMPVVAYVDSSGGTAASSTCVGGMQARNIRGLTPEGCQGPMGIAWSDWEKISLEASGASANVLVYPLTGASVLVTAGAALLNASGLSVDLRGLRSLTLDGNGTDARVTLRGSAGDDIFVARPDRVTWRSDTFTAEVRGVTTVDAFAGRGGADTASLWGSPGDDVLTIGVTTTSFTGPGFSFRIAGFGTVSYYPGPGGKDVARIYNAPGDQMFTVTPAYVSFASESTVHRVFSFPAVTIYGGADELDSVRLFDSPRDDLLWYSPGYFRWSGEGFDVQGTGFKHLLALSTAGGNDRATLIGSANSEMFRYHGGSFRLVGPGYQAQVNNFAYVRAYGRGGRDRAVLYDSSGDDTLTATPGYTTLVGPGFELRVYDVPDIQAVSNAGGKDTARIYPQDETVSVTLTAEYGALQGQTFSSRAWGFAVVVAYAPSDRYSSARLYGTAGAERVQVEPGMVALSGSWGRRYAVGFSDVLVQKVGGRSSVAMVLDSTPARLVVDGQQLQLSTETSRVSVRGFEVLQVKGQVGSDHRAAVAGTRGAELLEAFPQVVRLTGLELAYLVELTDFALVEVYSTGEGDQRSISEGVDYVLTFGSWIDR